MDDLDRLALNLALAGACRAAEVQLAARFHAALRLDLTDLHLPPPFDDPRDPGRLLGEISRDTLAAMWARARLAWGDAHLLAIRTLNNAR